MSTPRSDATEAGSLDLRRGTPRHYPSNERHICCPQEHPHIQKLRCLFSSWTCFPSSHELFDATPDSALETRSVRARVFAAFSRCSFGVRHSAGTTVRQSTRAAYLVSCALPPIHHLNGHVLCGRVLSHRIERISPGRTFLSQIALVTCSFATRRIHNGTSITGATSTFGRSVHDADGRKRTTSQPSMYKI